MKKNIEKKERIQKTSQEKDNEDKLSISEYYAYRIYENPFNKFHYDKNNYFWRYDKENGLWRHDAIQYIRNILRKEFLRAKPTQQKKVVEEIVSFIQDLSWNPNLEMKLPPHIIAFQNCLYDIEKQKKIDFSPEYLTTNKLPIELINEYKECPNIDKFIIESIGEEYKPILYELIAYCLHRGYPYQNIFFIFFQQFFIFFINFIKV